LEFKGFFSGFCRRLDFVTLEARPCRLKRLVQALKDYRLVRDAGVVWPSGSNKKWKKASEATFEFWMADPLTRNSTVAMFEEYERTHVDIITNVITQFFVEYQVDAEVGSFDLGMWKREQVVRTHFKLSSLF
jgi:hypothetical protein